MLNDAITPPPQLTTPLRTQLEWARFLNKISGRIKQSLVDEIETTVAEVRQRLHTDRVVVYRFDSDGCGRVVVESVGDRLMPMSNHTKDICIAPEWQLQQGQVVARSDIFAEDAFPVLKLSTSLQVRADVIVPLLQGETLWGLLIVHHSVPRFWQTTEIEFLEQLAVPVAIALQQAQSHDCDRDRLEAHLRTVNRSVRALSECNQAVVKATEETALLQSVCEILVKVGGYRFAWICTADRCIQPIGVDLPDNLLAYLDAEDSPANHAVKSESIYIVQNLALEAPTNWSQQLLDQGCRAVISLPLVVHQFLYGTLNICANQTDVFDGAEVELLTELADNIAYGMAALQTQTTLKRANELLEHQVAQRTAQLSQANEQLQLKVEEQKQTAAHLKEFVLKLELSNQELQDFAYIASHDLQEPLRKIIAFSDRLLAKHGDTLAQQGVEYFKRIQHAARRMQKLIDNILDFSRVTTRAQPFATINLTLVVQEVLTDLEIQIARTGGQVKVEPLPTIEADPTQMRLLLQNLIGNALKYHRPDQPPIVAIRGKIEENHCQLTVADNGIGFEERYLEQIFTIFQRLHGRSSYEGTGIGLAICRKIVERHNGSITARSTPNLGSVFSILLPVRSPETR